MDRLRNASEEGSIEGLYTAIRENPFILDHIMQIPFVDTPLHVAALFGHVQYAMEIIRLKPSFSKKSNQDGFTPLHIALKNQHFQLVLWLVDMDPDLVRVKGREGITPLHYVVHNGNFHLLSRFLAICPRSIEDVTIQNETVLHIALKYDMFEACEFILGRLHWDCHEHARYLEKKIVNCKNLEGNTVLHIATSKNQPQIVKLLIRCNIDVNTKNFFSQTALDIAEDEYLAEIKDLLCLVGATRASPLPTNDTTVFLRKELRLQMAAEEGDVDSLYSIICEDPHLLDHIARASFIDNPMHIAAARGHSQFVLEIMYLRPSLAKKLNQHGFSPMHLALQNDKFLTVRQLLDINRDLVRVKGRAGQTLLHYATEKGKVDILTDFLSVCPKSIEDLTTCKETALHIAAKKEMWEAFKILCGWLQFTGQNKVLDQTDDEGNTVLHIATSKSQLEVVRLLIGRMNLTVKNITGKTAMDVLNDLPPQTNRILAIKSVLFYGGALRVPKTTTLADKLNQEMSGIEKWALSRYRDKLLMSDENRNALLVVAILIATSTYQALLSPPGGLENGSPVLLSELPTVWFVFSSLNTATFIISLGLIYNLLPRRPLIVLPLVIPLFLCYAISWHSTQVGLDMGAYIFTLGFVAIPTLVWLLSTTLRRKWSGLENLIADAHQVKIEEEVHEID